MRQIVDDATAGKVADALASIEPKLQAMIEQATRRVEIVIPDAPAVTIDRAHNALPDLLKDPKVRFVSNGGEPRLGRFFTAKSNNEVYRDPISGRGSPRRRANQSMK